MNAFTKIIGTAFIAASVAVMSAGVVVAEELDAIKEKGVLRIAMSGAYPPFNFVNEKNEVVGFDAAIGTEIAKRMGLQAEIVTTAWDGIIGGLLANKYDAIVGSMSITEERSRSSISSAPITPPSGRSSPRPAHRSPASASWAMSPSA